MSFADFYIMHPQGQQMMHELIMGNDLLLERRRQTTELPKPHKDASWMALCRSSTWKYNPPQQHELYFAKRVKNDPMDHFERTETLKAMAPPSNIVHRGALAPKWVFEAAPKELPDDLHSYQQRLVCALSGRFVCMTRQGAHEQETLEHTNGRPREGTKYSWRFWDNDGNVYQDELVKCRNTIQWEHQGREDMEEPPQTFGLLPGDFTANKQTWMREGSSHGMGYFGKEEVYGPYYTNTSEFWDNIWRLKYKGTTMVPMWDGCLVKLAQLAGVPIAEFSQYWSLDANALDAIAASKG